MNTIHAADQRLELFTSSKPVHIYVSDQENSAVQIAAANLITDIKRVFGCKAVLSAEIHECAIIIATLDKAGRLPAAGQNAELPLELLKDEAGAWRWEAFLQQAVDGVFYIVGTDRRGTIFGIYDLCEAIGVSPWHYWGDVPAKIKDSYSVPADFSKADWPSVQYRGIFLNDEEELEDWAKLHTPDDTIGPVAYSRIFELLLRLKANYIWPAMHVNYFNGNPENGALAEQMGIVVGTSHCDMLLRSNQNEWTPWLESKGYTDAEYDYSIEGRNREILLEYWRESIEQNRNYEVCFTMGMRGIHDSGFHTRAIDEDDSLSKEQRKEAKVKLLGQVVHDQRQLLIEVLGEEKGLAALQTFVPYKEVLSLYDQGLELPEDLTLIWANDNFGHMRRYPSAAERSRSGGNGLYFHGSYWAAPGTGMSYLFINSIPLAQTGNELKKSWESGIRKVWVLNVGGLKPVEQDLEYFVRYGWEAGKAEGITKDPQAFTEHWINTNFTGGHGAEAAQLYTAFAQATNVRKIEHMQPGVFSQTAYGDEAGRRLMLLEDLYRRGNAILYCLPEEERAAFFQLFLMKIHASYYTNHEFYYADRSVLSYERGNMQAADRYAELSAEMLDNKRRMLHFYDRKLSGGKWEGILTPESFPPPPTALYPVRKPALQISGSGLRADLWNGEETLRFSFYGRHEKWIELGNQGAGSIPYTLEIGEGADWITLSDTSGTLQTEKRILVTVQEPAAHAGKRGLIVIRDHRNDAVIFVKVEALTAPAVPDSFTGYIEADGYVSIPADGCHYNLNVTNNAGDIQSAWLPVPGMARYEGAALMAWHPAGQPPERALQDNASVGYDIYVEQGGEYVLEVHRFLTLNSTGRIRFGVGVDDGEPVLAESDTNDEWKGSWQQSIKDNGEKLLVKLPYMEAGTHTLKLYMIDNYVMISKLVLYTNARQESNLGPAFSTLGHKQAACYGAESPQVDWKEVEALCSGFYSTQKEEVTLPAVLYADRAFFEERFDLIFQKANPESQTRLGDARYEALWKSTEDKNIIEAFGSGCFTEQDGVIAIEAEYALANSEHAYLTPAADDNSLNWSHLQAETNGRTGFAMHVADAGLKWEEPAAAPGMHYRINVHTPGVYHAWLLVRHHNFQSDSCYLALDGAVQPLKEQFGGGVLHTYNTAQVYYWCHISDLEISSGEHVLSILACESQLRVDRIYLSAGDEFPPADAQWSDSLRQ
ncbi:glycosyl hydrolase 115 family protein [Paenibacillus typhae]|uniref:Glycosyl hydrolase family 115 n=1 Tax=Paenibacillus typhae TaxID=1174501 RepID=A0A1G9EW75_9BACL|nr:glycosyl hydrolase 115 family protein [Paenibacillus typhae]SDK80384.1 Glycosyl hydrolase family 115 [Paenibacillus typhae]